MDLKNQNGAGVQGNASTKEGLNGVTATNGIAKKTETTPAAMDKSKADKGKEPAKDAKALEQVNNEPGTAEAKTGLPAKAPENLLPVKEEAKPVKPALNLEGTLKVVDELHRRSIQRVNLISRIRQLEAFEVNLTTENDELEENPYQGCKLIIEDDKQRRFITTTPGLIRMVAQFIFNACSEKLADIEANIVLPNA